MGENAELSKALGESGQRPQADGQELAAVKRELDVMKQETDARTREAAQLRARVQELENPAPPNPREYYHGSTEVYIAVRDAAIKEELAKTRLADGGVEWRRLRDEIVARLQAFTLPVDIRKVVGTILYERSLPKPPPPELSGISPNRESWG